MSICSIFRTDRRLDFHLIFLLLGWSSRSCMDVRGRSGVEHRVEQEVGRNKETGSLSQGADPDHRRCHGHHDPGVQARRSGLSRRALRRLAYRHQGQQRSAGADPAGGDPRDPRSVLCRRGRHPRDQHLQRHSHRHGRLRDGSVLGRDQPGGGPSGPRRGRRVDGQRSPQAALRGRGAGPHQPHSLHLAGRERSRQAQRHL